uniref:Uncharacterized protein n=1 Tax=Phocoena sinus TaxID=42100 RepID=A0A8C9BXL9_PHOSS
MAGEPSRPRRRPPGRAGVWAPPGRSPAPPTRAGPGGPQTETTSRTPTDTPTPWAPGASRMAVWRTRGPSSKMTTGQIPKMPRTGPSGEDGPRARTSPPASGAFGRSGRPWACGGRRMSSPCRRASGRAGPDPVPGTGAAPRAAGPPSSPTRTPRTMPTRSGRRPPRAATSARGGRGGTGPGPSPTPRPTACPGRARARRRSWPSGASPARDPSLTDRAGSWSREGSGRSLLGQVAVRLLPVMRAIRVGRL